MTEQSPPAAQTILIVIGNSDNRLTQARWADFIADVNNLVDGIEMYAGVGVHGRWHSYPDTPYQNASWLFTVNRDVAHIADDLKTALGPVAERFDQESIAWVVGETEFIDGGYDA